MLAGLAQPKAPRNAKSDPVASGHQTRLLPGVDHGPARCFHVFWTTKPRQMRQYGCLLSRDAPVRRASDYGTAKPFPWQAKARTFARVGPGLTPVRCGEGSLGRSSEHCSKVAVRAKHDERGRSLTRPGAMRDAMKTASKAMLSVLPQRIPHFVPAHLINLHAACKDLVWACRGVIVPPFGLVTNKYEIEGTPVLETKV